MRADVGPLDDAAGQGVVEDPEPRAAEGAAAGAAERALGGRRGFHAVKS